MSMTFELQSQDTKDIAAALAKAQGQIENASKDAANPAWRSTYATLASVINASSEKLSENGIAVVQATVPTENSLMIVTTLNHSSGQWFRSYTPLILAKQDMQGLGGAISYARRYALSAIIGISQEDDDAQSATDAKKNEDKKPAPVVAKTKETVKHDIGWAPDDAGFASNPMPPWDEPTADDPGDYVITFKGPMNGKKIKDIPVEQHRKSFEFFGAAPRGAGKIYVEKAKAYLNQIGAT
jgi:hypothetical protein